MNRNHLIIFAVRKKNCMKKGLLFIAATLGFQFAMYGQTNCGGTSVSGRNDCDQLNAITTAVPFLLITPDSRAGAMGDAGVAVSPDVNAQYWNASKLAFSEDEMQVSLSYSPWLRQLVDDMNLAYLAWYMKINKTSAVGASLRYFTLGDIKFTDQNGTAIRDYRPSEFSIDLSYSLQLSKYFSGGITARWINSSLTGGVSNSGADSKAANAFAVDISAFYTNSNISVGDKDAELNFGLNISNIGNKISYTNTSQRDFLPTNLRLGGAFKIELDQFNSFTLVYDANKLLVPTPPLYDPNDKTKIISGMEPDVGVATGMIHSFYDAPGTPIYDEQGNYEIVNGELQVEDGSKFREELHEINQSVGIEYWYADQFAVRAGYFYEHPTKGNRQYFNIGAGFRYNVFGLDLSYLIPTTQNNPLANTVRFTLSLNFAKTGPAATPAGK